MRMATKNAAPAARRPTNVSLRADLIQQAKDLGINVSQACETGLAAVVKNVREARWLADNLPALDAWNEWIREHGIPYAEYRHF